jgi:hypothetical protein
MDPPSTNFFDIFTDGDKQQPQQQQEETEEPSVIVLPPPKKPTQRTPKGTPLKKRRRVDTKTEITVPQPVDGVVSMDARGLVSEKETTTRNQPGQAMIVAERTRFERARQSLINRNDDRVANGQVGPTICSVLGDSLIDFYNKVVFPEFDTRFGKYYKPQNQ